MYAAVKEGISINIYSQIKRVHYINVQGHEVVYLYIWGELKMRSIFMSMQGKAKEESFLRLVERERGPVLEK